MGSTRQLGAVTVTPARQLEPREKLIMAALAYERAREEQKRTRLELAKTVREVEGSISITDIAQQLSVSRMQVYKLREAGLGA